MELDDLSLHPSDYVVYWSTFEKKLLLGKVKVQAQWDDDTFSPDKNKYIISSW